MKGTAYLIQSTLISLWWIGMLLDQNFYDAFQFPGIGNIAFNSFMLPDLIIVAILSVIIAYKKIRELEYVVLGGFGFATLYCINASILTGGGYLSTTVMIFGLCYNIFLISENRIFRNSNTNSLLLNCIKTFFQIICIWLITLFVFPVLIIESFGVSFIISSTTKIIGIFLFVFFSTIGLYSAIVMVKIGKGTPLPLDQTQNLVTKGPYKYVRNPMAIAGVGQGISISVFLGSIHILIYSIFGAFLWHFVVRPLEEKNMIERFGNEYEVYRSTVKCWLPKMIKDAT